MKKQSCNLKTQTLNRLLEWCVLNEKDITKNDQEFLNDITLTAIDNVLLYIEQPSEERLNYMKSYIVSSICASYNIAYNHIEQLKEEIQKVKSNLDNIKKKIEENNVDGDEWKVKT